jgi:hypothetical protein
MSLREHLQLETETKARGRIQLREAGIHQQTAATGNRR